MGGPAIGDDGQEIQIISADDLSGLADQQFLLQGQKVT